MAPSLITPKQFVLETKIVKTKTFDELMVYQFKLLPYIRGCLISSEWHLLNLILMKHPKCC